VPRQTVPLVSDSDLTATLIASSQAAAGAT
jgi:hypothetical protein